MVRILVLYGSSEGHTEKIATVMGNALIDAGFAADVIEAGTVDPDVASYDGVIVAASLHRGFFQKSLVSCVHTHRAEIAARPNAFVPVCLAVMQKNDPRVAADLDLVMQRFVASSGWTPSHTNFVAGALPYTRYNVITRWLMKRIAAKAGGDTDTSRDYVYTDWNEVKAFAVDFGRRVRGAAAA
jgi:menaquinone-dependent protoporphyrinogen oxidase